MTGLGSVEGGAGEVGGEPGEGEKKEEREEEGMVMEEEEEEEGE